MQLCIEVFQRNKAVKKVFFNFYELLVSTLQVFFYFFFFFQCVIFHDLEIHSLRVLGSATVLTSQGSVQ